MPPVAASADAVNLDYLTKNLKKLVKVIDTLEARTREETIGYPNVPPDLILAWSEELQSLVISALENRWSGVDVQARLVLVIRQGVADHFSDALHHWGLEDSLLQETARGLAAGDLRFSARLLGGLPTQVQSLVTSLRVGQTVQHGTQHIACATLRVWPGRPPLFLAATEAIPLEHLPA